MSIRAGCCGKKRKGSQLKWVEGYDGGLWRCKEGYGCLKPKKCNKPHVSINEGSELFKGMEVCELCGTSMMTTEDEHLKCMNLNCNGFVFTH